MKETAGHSDPTALIRERALALGFDALGFAKPAAQIAAAVWCVRFRLLENQSASFGKNFATPANTTLSLQSQPMSD